MPRVIGAIVVLASTVAILATEYLPETYAEGFALLLPLIGFVAAWRAALALRSRTKQRPRQSRGRSLRTRPHPRAQRTRSRNGPSARFTTHQSPSGCRFTTGCGCGSDREPKLPLRKAVGAPPRTPPVIEPPADRSVELGQAALLQGRAHVAKIASHSSRRKYLHYLRGQPQAGFILVLNLLNVDCCGVGAIRNSEEHSSPAEESFRAVVLRLQNLRCASEAAMAALLL